MSPSTAPIQVTIVGGGMITHDQILPSIYHLQRQGQVGPIRICAINSPPLKALAEAPRFAEAFPGQSFEAFPALTEKPDKVFPDLFQEVIAKMAPRRSASTIGSTPGSSRVLTSVSTPANASSWNSGSGR